jgi:hypothetical protein
VRTILTTTCTESQLPATRKAIRDGGGSIRVSAPATVRFDGLVEPGYMIAYEVAL